MNPTPKKTCDTCRYFLQHYGLVDERFIPVYCGHCTFSRVKARKPDSVACEHFISGTSPTGIFVTKQYLAERLINYVLALELLPEAEEPPIKTPR